MRREYASVARLIALLVLMGSLGATTQPSSRPTFAPTAAIFAVGFTGIEANKATIVFSTSQPMQATVTVRGAGNSPLTLGENGWEEIHRLDLPNLPANARLEVDITAVNQVGQSAKSPGHALELTSRPVRADAFTGRTLFGSGAIHGDAAAAEKMGLQVCRMEVGWGGVQPKPGEFSEQRLQQFVAMAKSLKQHGIEPLIVLDYCAPWAKTYTDYQMTWRNAGFGPPDQLADWEAYVRKVMQAMKGTARYYEVWNEPDAGYLAAGQFTERPTVPTPIARAPFKDNNAYWLGDRYLPMVMSVRQIADEVDPSVSIMNGGWNHDFHGTRGDLCFARGMQRYIQQYAFHSYAGPSFAQWHEAIDGIYVHYIDEIFARYKVRFPLTVTEWGVPVTENPKQGFGTEADRQQFILKASFYWLSLERMNMLVYFTVGGKKDSEWSLTRTNDRGETEILPSGETYRWICRTFSDKSYRKRAVETSDPQRVQAYAIELIDSGEVYVLLWQQQYDAQSHNLTALPAQEVQVNLSGITAGKYRGQRLDAPGALAEEISAGDEHPLRFRAPLAASPADHESAVSLYRFVRQ